MKVDKFAQQIEAVGWRVAKLHGRAEELPLQQQELLVEAFEELETVLEQLQLAEEELHQQNEDLAIAREAVEAERQRYQNLFEFAPDGYLVTDAKGTIREANRAAADLLNVSQQFLVGKPLLIFVAKEECLVFHSKLTRLHQVKRVQEWQIRLSPRNGANFDAALSVTAVYNQEGQPIALRWLLRDITQRQLAEEEVQVSERRFRQLAENIHEVFWMSDIRKSELLYISPAYEEIWGRTCQSMYEQPSSFLDAIHSEDAASVIASLENQSRGESTEEEYRIVRPDGAIRWIRDRSFPIKDESGQVYRVCGIAEDITDRKHAEEILRQQTERARLLGVICDRIRQSLDLREILNTTVAEVRQFLACDRVLIYRFQPDLSGVVVVESVGSGWKPMLTTTIREPREETYVLYQQGYIDAVEDIYTASLDQFHLNLLAQFQVRAKLVVPILQVRTQHSGVSIQELEELLDSSPKTGNYLEQSERNSTTGIEEARTEQRMLPTAIDRQNSLSALSPPNSQLWGLLIAHHCAAPRQWQPFEIDLLLSLATQVAIAIQQAQLYRQTQQQAQREKALNRFTAAIRSSLDLETIFATATQVISQLLHVDRVEIHQYLPDRQVWLNVVAHCQHADLHSSLGIVVPDGENEISRQLKRLEVARIDNTNTLKDTVSRELAQSFPGAWLLIPLHFQNILWGSLSLMISGRAYHWQDSEVELVSAIATHLAIAIQQAQYQQLSALNTDLEHQVQERTVELQQKIQELQELNILKDDFLSTVSHELRTPLAKMKIAIEMLKNAPLPERQLRYLEICQAECNREADLINDLLDLQRLEAQSYPISSREAVNIQDWLLSIVKPFHSRVQESQQTLQMDLPPDLPPVRADGAGLGRVLAELLNNACKYTPPGGKILLCVRYHFEPPVTTFTISNQAEIPAAALARIFEKFYRVPHDDPWKQGGTGLGLALVQKLVEQLGGTIQVESGGGWTTFTVQLPA